MFPTSPLVLHARVLEVLAWEIVLIWPAALAVALVRPPPGRGLRASLAAAAAAIALVAWQARLSL